MFSQEKLKEILLETKAIAAKELELYLSEAEKRNQTLENYLVSQKIINEEQLYQSASTFYNLPFTNLKNETIRKDILFLIPEPIAITHQVVAFDKNETELKIATLSPENLQIFEFLAKKTGLEPKVYITTPESMAEALKLYH